MDQLNNLDFYKLEMVLLDSEKQTQSESYKNLSLHDFEVIYGNETREIETMILIKQKEFERWKFDILKRRRNNDHTIIYTICHHRCEYFRDWRRVRLLRGVFT